MDWTAGFGYPNRTEQELGWPLYLISGSDDSAAQLLPQLSTPSTHRDGLLGTTRQDHSRNAPAPAWGVTVYAFQPNSAIFVLSTLASTPPSPSTPLDVSSTSASSTAFLAHLLPGTSF